MSVSASTDAGSAAPASAAPVLEIRNLVGGYENVTVLRDVSLTVPAGSVVALLGPNGAGKSTLLKMVAGVIRPTAGSILLGGRDVTHMPAYQRTRHGLCTIPEGRGVFRSLTVRENIALQVEKGKENDAVERAVAAFPILGERLSQQAGTMSGGQQQMLAMAQAYVKDADLILVDEASLGLAPVLVDVIFAFLHKVTEERNVSLLIVDQFVTRSLSMASAAYVLRHGEIVYDGSPADLLSGNVFEQYIGS
jgi:branched-chain amino acid transport system ATP-binding protein